MAQRDVQPVGAQLEHGPDRGRIHTYAAVELLVVAEIGVGWRGKFGVDLDGTGRADGQIGSRVVVSHGGASDAIGRGA